jgi:threonine/homoserine/homoserine lactone efflux protein
MFHLSTLLTYVPIVLGFVFIPGPATLLTIARAASSGTKAGIATGTGIAVGDLVHTFTAALGISALLAASATLFSIVKYIGAAYLIYLGAKAILEKRPVNAAEPLVKTSMAKAFRQAILTELFNPKTALFFLAFLPQFVRPEDGFVTFQLAVLGIVFVLLGLLSTIVYAACAARMGDFLRKNPAVLKWQGKVVGSIYCALGVRVATES